MTLGRSTEWFLAGWAVVFAITAPYWLLGVITVRDVLFFPLLGALVALIVGRIIDLITTTTKETNVQAHPPVPGDRTDRPPVPGDLGR